MLHRVLGAFIVGLAAAEAVCGSGPACPDPNQLYAQCINLEQVTSPWPSDARVGACTDSFVFAVTGHIHQIRWWGLYAYIEHCGPLDDDFIVSFWSDDEGTPAAPMIPLPSSYTVTRSTEPVGEFLTGLTPLQVYEYELTFDGDPFVAVSNVTYWLEIYNDLYADPTNCYWHWVGAPDPPGDGASYYRSGFSEPTEWDIVLENDRSFALLASLPVPAVSEWGMMALVLLIIVAGTIVFRRVKPAA